MNKYGFKTPVINPKDYFSGVSSVPQIVLRPDGQWDSFLGQDQFQSRPYLETYDCTGFGLENQTVIYLKERYGLDFKFSQRAIGINAGTGEGGNDPNAVYQSVRDNGFVPQELLSFSDDIKTIEQFYSPKPLTPDLIQAENDWKSKWDFFHEWCFDQSQPLSEKIASAKLNLTFSPLGCAVYAWAQGADGRYMKLGDENHWICIYGYTHNAWKVFDSYDNTHKLYAMENEINFCKRIHIEQKLATVKNFILGDIKNGFLNFIYNLFIRQ